MAESAAILTAAIRSSATIKNKKSVSFNNFTIDFSVIIFNKIPYTYILFVVIVRVFETIGFEYSYRSSW